MDTYQHCDLYKRNRRHDFLLIALTFIASFGLVFIFWIAR